MISIAKLFCIHVTVTWYSCVIHVECLFCRRLKITSLIALHPKEFFSFAISILIVSSLLYINIQCVAWLVLLRTVVFVCNLVAWVTVLNIKADRNKLIKCHHVIINDIIFNFFLKFIL